MRSKEIERNLAVGALAGDRAEEAEAMFTAGLANLRAVAVALRHPLAAAFEAKLTRGYVRASISRGRAVAVPFIAGVRPWGSRSPSSALVRLRSGAIESGDTRLALGVNTEAARAANLLARHAAGSVEDVLATLAAIERARKQCFVVSEKGTRWLP